MTCSICKEIKPAKDFSHYMRRECAITRRRACSEACSQCHKTCTTAHMFATGTNLCWKCYQAPRTRTCSRCQKECSTEKFDQQHISFYDASQIKYLLCKSCSDEGYRYKYIDAIRPFTFPWGLGGYFPSNAYTRHRGNRYASSPIYVRPSVLLIITDNTCYRFLVSAHHHR